MSTLRMNRESYVEPGVNETTGYPRRGLPMRLRHLSWGAIVAGIVIALVTMVGLQMLGLAIGAATINPEVEVNPVEPALGTGAIIWMIGSNLIALFLGGFVAGRFAGSPDQEDGLIHGLVTWGMVTLITLFLLTSSLAGLVNGVLNLTGQAISMAGSTVANVSPIVADAINMEGMTLQGIQGEIRALLQETNDPLAQGSSTTEGDQTTGASNTQNGLPSNSLTELELNRGFTELFTEGEVSAETRQNFVTVLSERTGITAEEAQQAVDRWELAYTEVRVQAEDTAREVSQGIADTVTLLAGAVFAMMVVGAFAAGTGGIIGSPEHLREVEVAAAATT